MGLVLNNEPSSGREISGTNLIRIDFSSAIAPGATNFTF